MQTEYQERLTVAEPLPRSRRIAHLWWLVAAALAAGVIGGYLVARWSGEISEVRDALYVGALCGLVAGLALALAWEPLLRRRSRGRRPRSRRP